MSLFRDLHDFVAIPKLTALRLAPDGSWLAAAVQTADAEGKKHPYRSGNIGFHHYAFELGKRQDVDGLYEVLKKHDVKVVDPPADYPDYGEGYYAVFFLDPDGLKLEGMVFKPPRKKKRARSRKNS